MGSSYSTDHIALLMLEHFLFLFNGLIPYAGGKLAVSLVKQSRFHLLCKISLRFL